MQCNLCVLVDLKLKNVLQCDVMQCDAIYMSSLIRNYIPIYIYGCESKIGYGSLRGDPYYGSGMLT